MLETTNWWRVTFGSGAAAVLGDGILFYAAGLLLFTYLGVGISIVLLPENTRPFRGLIAPFLGYSLLVVVAALLVAFGGSVASALLVATVLSAGANIWVLRRTACHGLPRPPSGWLLFVALSLPVYAITALSMAHNGSLAYVGGQGDLYLLVPLAEWIKTHPAPLFSLGSAFSLDPNWNASLPPVGGWIDSGVHLGGVGHRADDTKVPSGNNLYGPFDVIPM